MRAQQLTRGMSQLRAAFLITRDISLYFSLRAQQITLSVTIPSPATVLILIQNEQHRELGTGISGEHTQLKEDIERGANTSEVSERRRKDELMRAVDVRLTSCTTYPITTNPSQARGFILRHPYRETFPLPPPNIRKPDFDPEQMALQFNTHDGRPSPRLPDPNLTPISIPMYIRAPYFKPDPTSTTPFSTREENPVSENDTVASIIEGLFFSVGGFYGRGKYDNREGIQSTVEHEKHGVVLVITSRGRIFEIPRKMRIKDIVAGAQWPRPQSATEIPVLEDLRKEPRERGDNIDGIEMAMGWFMEIYVIPKENLGEL